MPQERIYTTADLLHTYIAAQRPAHSNVVTYYQQLVQTLQQAFGLVLTTHEGVEPHKRALYMLFQAAIQSFVAIRTPASTFADSSLITKQLERSPIATEVQRTMHAIQDITAENVQLHRALIETLFAYLYQPVDTTITSHALYLRGFDDSTEPDPNAYDD